MYRHRPLGVLALSRRRPGLQGASTARRPGRAPGGNGVSTGIVYPTSETMARKLRLAALVPATGEPTRGGGGRGPLERDPRGPRHRLLPLRGAVPPRRREPGGVVHRLAREDRGPRPLAQDQLPAGDARVHRGPARHRPRVRGHPRRHGHQRHRPAAGTIHPRPSRCSTWSSAHGSRASAPDSRCSSDARAWSGACGSASSPTRPPSPPTSSPRPPPWPRARGIDLVALFGPEHGIAADAQDLVEVGHSRDRGSGLPVYSLYGRTRVPTRRMLAGLDAVVFDLQDVGSRYYTYVYTLLHVLEACAREGKRVIVLDRPNPLGGEVVEGNVLDPEYRSFVGLHPLAVRHGMTAGELALMFRDELDLDVDLRVVRMRGWRRAMHFEDTGLPWVLPSPNMPTPDTAFVYPGGCLVEGTNLSEGRGTTRPFELVGAPWLDGPALARSLEKEGLDGVGFRPGVLHPDLPEARRSPLPRRAGPRERSRSLRRVPHLRAPAPPRTPAEPPTLRLARAALRVRVRQAADRHPLSETTASAGRWTRGSRRSASPAAGRSSSRPSSAAGSATCSTESQATEEAWRASTRRGAAGAAGRRRATTWQPDPHSGPADGDDHRDQDERAADEQPRRQRLAEDEGPEGDRHHRVDVRVGAHGARGQLVEAVGEGGEPHEGAERRRGTPPRPRPGGRRWQGRRGPPRGPATRPGEAPRPPASRCAAAVARGRRFGTDWA